MDSGSVPVLKVFHQILNQENNFLLFLSYLHQFIKSLS